MELEIAREKPNILITGTPGVGKTTLSKLLKEYVDGLQVIHLGRILTNHHISERRIDKPAQTISYLELRVRGARI
jgi:broad-specificity NMP kinase